LLFAGLIQLAAAEHEVAQYASFREPQDFQAESTPLFLQTIKLESELSSLKASPEESIQVRACLLWAELVRETQEAGRQTGRRRREPTESPIQIDERASRLIAEGIFSSPGDLSHVERGSTWTKICFVKSAYIKGVLLYNAGRTLDSIRDPDSVASWLRAHRDTVLSIPQLSYWCQQTLARIAVSAEKMSSSQLTTIVPLFQQWSAFAPKSSDIASETYGNPTHIPRSVMWKATYRFTSNTLQAGSALSAVESVSKLEQYTQLRRIESLYENELLRTTQFPKATESNSLIENWVEQVIRNWQKMCDPEWSESDFGEGGRNSAGRNVLDILHRASMKTFHSTLILRRLFQVHKTLADFDLAYRALDTYIELIDRGRVRAKKSGEPAVQQDNDELVLKTISEGVEGLCSFGRRAQAEKAHEMCLKLEILMSEILPQTSHATELNGHVEEVAQGASNTGGTLSSDALEIAYRAIGIGKAHWAKWTPFNERRTSLQAEAVRNLKTAVKYGSEAGSSLQSLYALSLLLAETRDVEEAIRHVKQALATEIEPRQEDGTFILQKRLIPFWHLLSLLLTARQDFTTAEQGCVAALDQFPSSKTLFGDLKVERTASFVSEKTTSNASAWGLVDDMECDELQRIIEIRITELALSELAEGPEDAVNSSNGLLELYSRLFGRFGVSLDDQPATKVPGPLKSSAGTIGSVKGSIFGRRKATPSSIAPSEKDKHGPSISEATTRPATRATQAPTIHVTDETQQSSSHKHHGLHHSHSKSSTRRSSVASSHKRHSISRLVHRHSNGQLGQSTPSALSSRQSFETSHETPIANSTATKDLRRPQLETIQTQEELTTGPNPVEHNTSITAKQPIKAISHNLGAHDHLPKAVSHSDQPPEQDVRLPTVDSNTSSTSPAPRFPRAATQKHALTILTKIWLVIATLYRRSTLFPDAREAIDEAAKAALKVEQLVATVESSARAFADPGWGGGGKSSDQIWSDVYCERAELQLAIARTREEKDGVADDEGVREAVEQYEICLSYFADHPGGIVGLSNLLLDYYERKVELGRRLDDGRPTDSTSSSTTATAHNNKAKNRRSESAISDDATPRGTATCVNPNQADDDLKKTPQNLNRLAARDRAYGLLSTLTKSGLGWDNSEAWFALARAHELGGEIAKAKEILWWCVELEDSRPIRHWSNVGCGGYVL